MTDLHMLVSACIVTAQWMAFITRRARHRCVCMVFSPVCSPCWEHDTGSPLTSCDMISLVEI